ncbi:MAG: alpha/beta hydrolase [Cyanobacteria bacterium J06573_11]
MGSVFKWAQYSSKLNVSQSGDQLTATGNQSDLVGLLKLLSPKPADKNKPLFVFLPGMDGSGTLLQPQVERLAPWFDIRCLMLSAQDDQSNWMTLAQQVSQLITEAARPQERAIASNKNSAPPSSTRRRAIYLCGESFGGCLGMQVLTLSPHLFEKAIFINPASSFRRLPWMQLGPLITRQLPSLAYRYSARGLVPFLIEPSRVDKQNRLALETAMGNVPAKTAAWRMTLLSKFDAERLPLERMTHPVLLIGGGNDRLLPSTREVKALQRRFPSAQVTLLPRSGHACLLETDTNLISILRAHQFLPAL